MKKTIKVIKRKQPKVTNTPKGTAAIPSKTSTDIVDAYTANIKVFGRFYTSFGSSVKNAIENLKVDGKVGGICVLIISKGDKKQEKILNAGQLFRLFSSSRVMHEIAIKNVCNLFTL